MSKFSTGWPTKEELKNINPEVDLSPYAIISRYADALYEIYDQKLIGVVMARYRKKENGDSTDFTYSLYITKMQPNKSAQLKLLEFTIQDDGWYPVSVSIFRGATVGEANNEEQLHTLIKNAIKSDFVKAQLKSLLD